MSALLILDIIMITLLVAAIIYAVILDNHLSATKENYRMLSHLIEQFYQASQRMQEELTGIQQSEHEMKQGLMAEMDKAALLKDELSALVTRIEQKTHTLESVKLRKPFTAQSSETLPDLNEMDLSTSEKELLAALNELR